MSLPADRDFIEKFETDAGYGITKEGLEGILEYEDLQNIRLIKGFLPETILEYLKKIRGCGSFFENRTRQEPLAQSPFPRRRGVGERALYATRPIHARASNRDGTRLVAAFSYPASHRFPLPQPLSRKRERGERRRRGVAGRLVREVKRKNMTRKNLWHKASPASEKE